VSDRIVLVEYDDDGKRTGSVYHNIGCLETGRVYGAKKSSAPIKGHYRAVVFGAATQGLRPCSHCGG
jgi:hypothetical protein